MGEIAEQIEREVCSWPGVECAPHRFGGTEFRAAGHELGHLHGDRLVDLPFPVAMRRELVEAGRALPHHVLPDTGWVSYRLASLDDVPGAVALFRLNFERIAGAAAEEPVQQAEPALPETKAIPQTEAAISEAQPA